MLTRTRQMAAQVSLEESLAILQAKFVDNRWAFLAELQCSIILIVWYLYSCESAPRALVAFLEIACGAESGRTVRSNMYRQLYSLLWVSGARFAMNFTILHHALARPSFQYVSHIRTGHWGCQPSYIYPETLKAVVRARFPDKKGTESKPNPEGSSVRTSIHTCI